MKSNNVVFRDIDTSPALNNTIHKRLDKLHRFSDRIINSRVVLDVPHRHKHKGKLYRAFIGLDLAGEPISIRSENSSVHLAVRDAFETVERQLKKAAEKRRPV